MAAVGNPTVLALRSETAEIDGMVGRAPHPDNCVVLHGDVQSAAVRAQETGRMDPAVRLADDAEVAIDAGIHGLILRACGWARTAHRCELKYTADRKSVV